jgi:hypothetical protein
VRLALASEETATVMIGGDVKRIVSLLAVVTFFSLSPEVPAQEQTPSHPARYQLIQALDETFFEKVNDRASQGYRLSALTAAPTSLVAIMEHMEEPSPHFNYLPVLIRPVKHKHGTIWKVREEITERLNEAGEKGYRLHMTVRDIAVMESTSDSKQHYQYAVTLPGGFMSFKKDDLPGLLAAGYHWAGAAITFAIFERTEGSAPAQRSSEPTSKGNPDRRFTFAENNFAISELPEKQLYKLASGGARVVDVFGTLRVSVVAMEETIPPSAPYEYVVLKPRNEALPVVERVKMAKVEAADVNRAAQQGFRLLSLTAPVPPFVMEKTPGRTKHYEYQFVTASKLPELADQLNRAGMSSFHIAKLTTTEDGFLVVMEKSDAQ